MSIRTPREQPGGCAGIRELADRAGVRLGEQLRDVSRTTGTEDAGAALSHTNLRGIVRLCDDVVGQIGKVEEPATHRVEFRIDQFINYFHDFHPLGLRVNNIWLEASQRLTERVATRGSLFHL